MSNQYQTITRDTLDAMDADIVRRLEIQRTMAEHTRPVLSLELNIAEQTVADIESGVINHRIRRSVSDYAIAQTLRRRSIWRLANDQIQDYTLAAISKRHHVCTGTVINRVKRVRQQMHAAAMEPTYGQKVAA